MKYITNPNLSFVDNLDFYARHIVEGYITGLHKSPFHGYSVEFSEHRIYNTGESTKHMDWKLYGKSDKLYIKKFEEETNLKCHLVIDCSSSMFYPNPDKIDFDSPNKLLFSLISAASLMNLFRKQRDAFGISFFNDNLFFHTRAKSSKSHQHRIFIEFEKILKNNLLVKRNLTNNIKIIHDLSERIPKRSLIIFFTDLFDVQLKVDEYMTALNHLKFNNNELVIFHVVNKSKEINFNFKSDNISFLDMETEKKIQVNPRLIKNDYVNQINSFISELKIRCGKNQIDFQCINSDDNFQDVLTRYVIGRKKLI